ncbi:WD40 repeat domain-containing serine/threonine protein kinase [Urbifossiella limnaea]|uniref:non-specific serine/threonine protein kinase n=1 Tax=Urbifossiella limnaea TaxID=2528023 RepID=A0A517XN81_9BACT|nr:Serine/threonine-protein kinase PrkC [Urbifossiella limnaea]
MPPPATEPDIPSVVDDFIRRLWAGDTLDPDAIILEHPQHAAELEQQLQTALRFYQEIQTFPRLGRYRLAAQLGAGGSAVVYRAIDTSTHQTVALKVFRPACLPDRLERDARLLLRLKHPNIVRFLDSGVTDDQPYLAMELVDGGSLATRVASGVRYHPAEVVGLIRKLAHAVQYAHEQGVIHRDIKPGNILIDAAGEPQLIDFGLARDLTNPGVTRAGEVLGTPLYMAPEQVGGNARDADARTDVYALGAVFYELLTGRPPFSPTGPVGLARQIAEDAPPRPRHVRPGVPRTLEAVCLRCLEKEPGDRFQSAEGLATELRHWSEGRSQRVWHPSRAGRVRRWWRRQKLWARRAIQVAGTLAVACAGLGWTAWTLNQQARADRRGAELERRAAELAREKEAQEGQARARAEVQMALARGWRSLQEGRVGRLREVRESLAAVGRAWEVLPEGHRGAARFEARTLFAMSLAAHDIDREPDATIPLPMLPLSLWSVAAHPGGAWLAAGSRTKPIRLNPGSKPPPDITPPELGEPSPRLAFSPDGRFLAFAPATGGLQIWDGELRQSRPLAEPEPAPGGPPIALSFASDGCDLRACFADGRVRAWRADGWAPRGSWTLPREFGVPAAARFAPAGDRVAVGSVAGRVRVFTSAGQPEPDRFASAARTQVESLAWTADGRTLAAGFKEGRVVVWEEGKPERAMSGRFPNGVGSLEYAPDGSVLCASRATSESLFWDPAGRVILAAPFSVVEFGRAGRTVTISDSQGAGVARWVEPAAIRTLRGHQTAVGKLAYSADGKRLASVDASFEGWVWDLESGGAVASYPLPIGGFYTANCGLALSSDGRWLAFASGGRERSAVVVRDLTRGREAGRWELPGGFDHLAALGGDRFRLVREEFVGQSEVLQSVLYDLNPTHGPERLAVVRPAHASDVRRHFEGLLTPGGRYYAWVGPRLPRERTRVEIVDLEGRRTIHSRALPQPIPSDPALRVDPSGQGIARLISTDFQVSYSVGADGRVREEPAVGDDAEPGLLQNWAARARSGDLPRDWEPLMGLTGGTFVPEDRTAWYFRSPDRRWLVWSDASGLILVAEREPLFRLVNAFDRETFR